MAVGTIVSQRPVDAWKDGELTAFTARVHESARRFFALEAIVTAERNVPGGDGEKEARLISLARADGSMESEIVWIGKKDEEKLKAAVAALEEQYPDKGALKGILALLGERVFS